jgi:Ca2+-binding RTX toxin-like protein
MDHVYGGDGDDYIEGGLKGDRLYGEAGDDTIYGGAGTDRIYGGDGDDYIDGGEEIDILNGGAGDDYIVGGGYEKNTIIDTEGDNTFFTFGGKDYYTVAAGSQNTWFIVGKSGSRENRINFLDDDDVLNFRLEMCTKWITFNVGTDISSDIVGTGKGPYKVYVDYGRMQNYKHTVAKICNKRRQCEEWELPESGPTCE